MWEKRSLSVSHQSIKRSTRQSTSHFGGDTVEKEFIKGGQENADRGHGRYWLKVVVGCLGRYSTLASPCERANLDHSLGID